MGGCGQSWTGRGRPAGSGLARLVCDLPCLQYLAQFSASAFCFHAGAAAVCVTESLEPRGGLGHWGMMNSGMEEGTERLQRTSIARSSKLGCKPFFFLKKKRKGCIAARPCETPVTGQGRCTAAARSPSLMDADANAWESVPGLPGGGTAAPRQRHRSSERASRRALR